VRKELTSLPASENKAIIDEAQRQVDDGTYATLGEALSISISIRVRIHAPVAIQKVGQLTIHKQLEVAHLGQTSPVDLQYDSSQTSRT
jgi:hypothetical protein